MKTAKALECDYYFAYPYSFWQRGVKENTNQFLSKGDRIEEVTEGAGEEDKGAAQQEGNTNQGACWKVIGSEFFFHS